MDPVGAPLFLILILLGFAVLSFVLSRHPRLATPTSVAGFAAAELFLIAWSKGRLPSLPFSLETELLSSESGRVEIASLVVLMGATSFLLVHAISDGKRHRGSLGALFLLGTTGGLMSAFANHLAVLAAGLELAAAGGLALTVFPDPGASRAEAFWKSFCFHALGGACFLFGCALLGAHSGSLSLSAIRESMGQVGASPLCTLSFLLIWVGLAQRMGALPLAFAPPDVAEGAHRSAMYHDTLGRLAPLAAIGPLFLDTLMPVKSLWIPCLWAIGAGTLLWGCLGALAQDNLKRLMSYLTQAQIGWLLLGVAAAASRGEAFSAFVPSVLLFGAVNLGLRAGIAALQQEARDTDVFQLSGLAESHPLLSLWWTLLCLAGAGFPPTGGFHVQMSVLRELAHRGSTIPLLFAVAGSLTASASYLKIVSYLYGRHSHDPLPLARAALLPNACTAVCAWLTVALLFLWK